MIRVAVCLGQGVFVQGHGYGVIWRRTSPTEVQVKFRDGFETVSIDQLLPVVALTSVAYRFEERDIELELPSRIRDRDAELVPDVSDEESTEHSSDKELEDVDL